MTDNLDKHVERLDAAWRQISEVEDDHTIVTMAQSNIEKTLLALPAKVEGLETRSPRNNIGVVGIAESTAIDNMERYIEELFVTLLGCKTFSGIFVVQRVHRLLAPQPSLGAPPCLVIAKLLDYRDRDAAVRKA
ncbi:hypothetical protein NDU88_006682 [Pleurodeles waltl]|uniref:Uncharacterized protein n=1 Tax=Pleurodeles waltl TaxID=8319 RepID=A0AAV7VQB9_PLEWA|nr:hypothetical protein NDU88_006682 [Pleurodeles waltl]